MKNTFKHEVLRSVIVMPLLVSSLSFGSLDSLRMPTGSLLASSAQQNTEEVAALSQQQITMQERADAIDSYFRDRNMPLEGKGMKMVQVAEENGLDWRLIPAISVIETTGGKFICKSASGANNAFGWGSCKIAFKSIDEGIETVGRNLGGNNPKTAHYYDEKDLKAVLKAYNSVIPTYYTKITSVMEKIGPADLGEIANA